MVVQHNLTAMNSNRMLGITTKAQAKATEKLSSGYKINRAADDAAGLAISEKMRKQIRGLTQASLNAQDGISAVQTAEGALTEVHDMIQRMNELAVKSANGTNSQEERDYIQREVDQLVSEIDRVAETTKFNDLYLLRGGDETATVNTSAEEGQTFKAVYAKSGKEVAVKDSPTTNTVYAAGSDTAITGDDLKALLTMGKDSDGNEIVQFADTDAVYYSKAHSDGQTGEGIHVDDIGETVDVGTLYDNTGAAIKESDLKNYIDTDGHMLSAMYSDSDHTKEVTAKTLEDFVNVTKEKAAVEAGTKNVKAMKLNLHVGAESAATNKISVTIKKMDADTIGVKGLNVSSEASATAAIDKLNGALRIVSEQRADLGAVQNRLEHTISNLDNVVENTTSAESQIRDTDMATQMVTYSNNNILAQAGQAMLAQSNQANQGVLSLLG